MLCVNSSYGSFFCPTGTRVRDHCNAHSSHYWNSLRRVARKGSSSAALLQQEFTNNSLMLSTNWTLPVNNSTHDSSTAAARRSLPVCWHLEAIWLQLPGLLVALGSCCGMSEALAAIYGMAGRSYRCRHLTPAEQQLLRACSKETARHHCCKETSYSHCCKQTGCPEWFSISYPLRLCCCCCYCSLVLVAWCRP